jgi:hypothetical protein
MIDKMQQSKFWRKMQILRKDRETKSDPDYKSSNIYISTKPPPIFVENKYKIEEIHENSDLEKISRFYSEFYKIGKSNAPIIELPIEKLKNILKLHPIFLNIKSLENENIGYIINFPTPLKWNLPKFVNNNILITNEKNKSYKSDDSDFIGSSSYLVLDKKYRGQGYGMSLIQESLKKLYEYSGLGAFFLGNQSRCSNSIKIPIWYYPLNFDNLERANYPYAKDHKNIFNINESSFNMIPFEKYQDSKKIYDFYTNEINQNEKKACFYPSFEYFVNWFTRFHSFIIFSSQQIVGIVSFNNLHLKYSDNIHAGSLNFMICKKDCIVSDVLKSIIYSCKKEYDILYIFEMGYVDMISLKKNYCQPSHKTFLNFFNINVKLKKEDILFPIL